MILVLSVVIIKRWAKESLAKQCHHHHDGHRRLSNVLKPRNNNQNGRFIMWHRKKKQKKSFYPVFYSSLARSTHKTLFSSTFSLLLFMVMMKILCSARALSMQHYVLRLPDVTHSTCCTMNRWMRCQYVCLQSCQPVVLENNQSTIHWLTHTISWTE